MTSQLADIGHWRLNLAMTGQTVRYLNDITIRVDKVWRLLRSKCIPLALSLELEIIDQNFY